MSPFGVALKDRLAVVNASGSAKSAGLEAELEVVVRQLIRTSHTGRWRDGWATGAERPAITVSLPMSRAMSAPARRRRRCPLGAAERPQDDERHAVAQGSERREVATVADHRRQARDRVLLAAAICSLASGARAPTALACDIPVGLGADGTEEGRSPVCCATARGAEGGTEAWSAGFPGSLGFATDMSLCYSAVAVFGPLLLFCGAEVMSLFFDVDSQWPLGLFMVASLVGAAGLMTIVGRERTSLSVDVSAIAAPCLLGLAVAPLLGLAVSPEAALVSYGVVLLVILLFVRRFGYWERPSP